jgi:hypothetical protein
MKLLIPVLLMAFGVQAAQSADVPPTVDSVRQVIRLTNPQQTLDAATAQLEESFRAGLDSELGNAPPTPAQEKIINDMQAKMAAVMKSELNWQNFEPAVIDMYRQAFTQREIDGMIAFYKSEAGAALLAKLPQLSRGMMQVMQQRTAKFAPQLVEIQHDAISQLRALKAEGEPPRT